MASRKTIGIGTPSTGNSADGTNSLSFSHTVEAGNHRVLIVGVGAVDSVVSTAASGTVTQLEVALEAEWA